MSFDLVVLLALSAAAVAMTIHQKLWSQRAQGLKKLKSRPSRTVADLRPGQIARVRGTVVCGEERHEGPVTGRPCVYYHAELVGFHKGNSVTLASESRQVGTFFLESEGELALVDARAAQVMINVDHQEYISGTSTPSARIRAFAERHGQSAKPPALVLPHCYREGLLEEGELVTVYGQCKLEPDPNASVAGVHGSGRAVRKRIVAPPNESVLISDELRVVEA